MISFLSPGPALLPAQVMFAERCVQPKHCWLLPNDVLRFLCTPWPLSWANTRLSSCAVHLIQAPWDGNSP